jgi:hypothetical protein
LLQLRATTIPIFQQSVLQWQRDYFEAKLEFTPATLITKADQECQVLQHAGQWVETIDPSVMAMQAMFQATKTQSVDLLQTLAANFSQISQRQRDSVRSSKYPASLSSSRAPAPTSHPTWLSYPPKDLEDVKHYNGRYWHWCTKCGKDGRWVCTHTDATHGQPSRFSSPTPTSSHPSALLDMNHGLRGRSRSPAWHQQDHYGSHRPRGHSRSRSRSPTWSGMSSASTSPRHHVSWQEPAPLTPVTKLSLLDSISAFMDDEV